MHRKWVTTLIGFNILISFSLHALKKVPEANAQDIKTTYNRRVLLTLFNNEQHDKNKDYLSLSIPDAFSTPLTKTKKFVILDRSSAELYLRAMAITPIELLKDENAVRLGKAIGADVVVVGKFVSHGKMVSIEAKAIDVHAGIASVKDFAEIKTDASMFQSINKLAIRMSGPMAEKLQPLLAPPPPPEIAIEEIKEAVPEKEPVAENSPAPIARNTWLGNIWKKNQFLRIAGALPYIMRIADASVNRYYGSGVGFLAEYQWFNLFLGGTYKAFWVTDQADLFQTAKIQIYTADLGYLYQIPWTPEKFWGVWSLSAGILGRYVWAREIGADALTNTFKAIGVVGKIVISYQFIRNPSWIPGAVFLDLRYGYAPIGLNKTNIEGIQLFMGCQWRIR